MVHDMELKVLLLWAALIALARCQNLTDPVAPVATVAPVTPGQNLTVPVTAVTPVTPAPPPSAATARQSNSTEASTTSAQMNTTIAIATTEDPTKNQSCIFSVTPSDYGFQIVIKDPGNFEVSVSEPNQAQDFQPFSTNVTGLKPCTEYRVSVRRRGGVACTNRDNSTSKTNDMKTGDFTYKVHSIGRLSIHTDWNISCENITDKNNAAATPCGSDCCLPTRNEDLCTNFTISFNQAKCSLTDTVNLEAEKFIDLVNLTPKQDHRLPPTIKLDQLQSCDLKVDYFCGESQTNLSRLEPFKDYTCVGNVTFKDKIIKTTPPVHVSTYCDLELEPVKPTQPSNTSITLKWETKTDSTNCDISRIQPQLQYICTCSGSASEMKKSETCTVGGLMPFTEYWCNINVHYGNKSVATKPVDPVWTQEGVPDEPRELKDELTENNAFRVTCAPIRNSRGKRVVYKARLLIDSKQVDKSREEDECSFTFSNLQYSTTYRVEVKVFNGALHSKVVTKEVSTIYNDKAVIGFLVVLILITSVALIVVLYKIYVLRRRKAQDQYGLIPIPPNEEASIKHLDPIPSDALLETYKKNMADEGRLFFDEFQSIPRVFSKFPMKEAEKKYNAAKNRYTDILPFDYNRVQLTTGNGEQGCDYINASFIDGYKENRKYIAAQGPKDETITDFWRMIWEQKSSVIVMVTRCEEGSRVKCAQYWPSMDRGAEVYEEFVVKVNSEEECPDYMVRHLSLTNKREKNSERVVTHIQFLSWPDHGVPEEAHLLLKLRRRVNAFKNLFSGPIVVHCSAGVGRTGTYMGIDAMMECLEAEGRVDVYGFVVQLRRQRVLMVQMEKQYILIYQALLEHTQFGETEVSLSELHSTVTALREPSSEEDGSLLHDEFQRVPLYKDWRTFNYGITEENRKKNRCSSVLPYDYNRVVVRSGEESSRDSDDEAKKEESSDEEEDDRHSRSSRYINASHINGYWGPHCFITAQTPLAETAAEFWLMVYQRKVSHIIMLSDSPQEDTDASYWSSERTQGGDVEVEVTNTETTSAFVKRTMNVRHVKRKESQQIGHYQFLSWGDGEVPENGPELLQMLKDVRSQCGGGRALRGAPALVHCRDGSSRSGLLVALWNLLDSADTEKLVDVFQVVKTLRKERSAMIDSLEQYQFLYDSLKATFPAQNGEVKAPPASAVNCVEVIDETTPAEPNLPNTTEPEDPEPDSCSTGADQQEAAPENSTA